VCSHFIGPFSYSTRLWLPECCLNISSPLMSFLVVWLLRRSADLFYRIQHSTIIAYYKACLSSKRCYRCDASSTSTVPEGTMLQRLHCYRALLSHSMQARFQLEMCETLIPKLQSSTSAWTIIDTHNEILSLAHITICRA